MKVNMQAAADQHSTIANKSNSGACDCQVSPEQRILIDVLAIVDGSHADDAEQVLGGSVRSAASLKAHVDTVFMETTEEPRA